VPRPYRRPAARTDEARWGHGPAPPHDAGPVGRRAADLPGGRRHPGRRPARRLRARRPDHGGGQRPARVRPRGGRGLPVERPARRRPAGAGQRPGQHAGHRRPDDGGAAPLRSGRPLSRGVGGRRARPAGLRVRHAARPPRERRGVLRGVADPRRRRRLLVAGLLAAGHPAVPAGRTGQPAGAVARAGPLRHRDPPGGPAGLSRLRCRARPSAGRPPAGRRRPPRRGRGSPAPRRWCAGTGRAAAE
jgi:hypothetical protein